MFGKTEKKETVSESKDIQDTKSASEGQLSALDEMDRMFDQFLKSRWQSPFSWNIPEFSNFKMNTDVRVPAVDVVEKDNNIIVRAEVPGIDKNNIEVTLNDNFLTIQGKTKHESKEATEEFHRSEISTGSFSRTLALPADRKSTRLNSSHITISYAVFCLKKKTTTTTNITLLHPQNIN